jgi:hypothetical protein
VVIKASSFPAFEVKEIAKFMDVVFSAGLPYLNIFLKTLHLDIPSTLLGMFKLSDVALTYENGYLVGGATPTFLAPKSSFAREALDSEDEDEFLQ